MTMSRRSLLRGVGLAVLWRATALSSAGVLVPSAPAAASPPRSRKELDLETATADTFRPHVGTRFHVKESGRRLVDVELTEVVSMSFDGRTDCFSLLFRSTKAVDVLQKTYGIEHAELGTWSMFVVPVGAGRIEAVVNHALP